MKPCNFNKLLCSWYSLDYF